MSAQAQYPGFTALTSMKFPRKYLITMQMGPESYKKPTTFERSWRRIKDLYDSLKKVGEDDPRRVMHSLKVGLALASISLFCYFQPTDSSFGASAMWAVMTVVVVFEFFVGATIGKGLNRGLATLVAGALGVGVHHLAGLSGKIGEPVLVGLFVFLQDVCDMGSGIDYIRQVFPQSEGKIRLRFDHLHIDLQFASSVWFQTDEILELAHKRLSTVLIGASACVIISIFVCPVWAGEDLHNLVAGNVEKLANFLEGFGDEYFESQDGEQVKDKQPVSQDYQKVLNSESKEETLVNLARWEPGHGQFTYSHPWKRYLKIGTLARQCAYHIEALNGYLNSKKSVAGFWRDSNLLEIVPVITVASLLRDVVICTEKLSESVHELASLAHFKTSENLQSNLRKNGGGVVINVDGLKQASPEIENTPAKKSVQQV
ncbi:unnamed protein product [Thlaspi arvense]|uniref:Aluminum-activated malate transporter n=1 Tax=Thlaspi arvense TaxID=13288 RepID=A0AAU9S699_THLAR|nr:unnamed protein product [Thlaspi arvense]